MDSQYIILALSIVITSFIIGFFAIAALLACKQRRTQPVTPAMPRAFLLPGLVKQQSSANNPVACLSTSLNVSSYARFSPYNLTQSPLAGIHDSPSARDGPVYIPLPVHTHLASRQNVSLDGQNRIPQVSSSLLDRGLHRSLSQIHPAYRQEVHESVDTVPLYKESLLKKFEH